MSVSLEFPRSRDDIWPLLTLRDDEGRELRTPLSALPRGAAASLLAGIARSAEDSQADLASPAAQAAVTALHELARADPPPRAPQDPGGPAPSTPAAG